jgi:hypothetical protein
MRVATMSRELREFFTLRGSLRRVGDPAYLGSAKFGSDQRRLAFQSCSVARRDHFGVAEFSEPSDFGFSSKCTGPSVTVRSSM